MAQERCRLSGCELTGTLRGDFCSEAHRDENKRAGWRRRKQKQRAADAVLGVSQYSDGRSIPRSADSYTPPTVNHPSRRFARIAEPDVVDYTVPGATDRPGYYQNQRVIPQQHLQRFRMPTAEQENWGQGEDEPGEPYTHDAVFTNDNWQGTWDRTRGPAFSGTPQSFQVVRRASR